MLNRYTSILFAFLCIILLIKIPHLSLPYFWDESWSYGPAIHYMYHHGLGLLPGSLPPELSRGHPLLFYFLTASGMKIFGSGLVGSHILPLIFSLLLIAGVFYFAKTFFNEEVALMSSIYLGCQALFLTQADLLLPEIFTGLCTTICFYGYLKNRFLLYFLSAAAFILTKETGIIVIAFFIICEVFDHLISKKKIEPKNLIKQSILTVSPVIPGLIFFALQKKQTGWYFFPEHMEVMQFNIKNSLQIVLYYLDITFVSHGKFLSLITGGICIALILFRNKEDVKKILKPIYLILLFSGFYFFFMSVNFFNYRYALAVIPLIACCICAALHYGLSAKPGLKWFSFGIIVLVISFNAYSQRYSNNETLGYIDVVKTNQGAIDFLKEKNYYDSVIYTPFLMRVNMVTPESGYLLPQKRIFSNLAGDSGKVQLYIFTDVESAEDRDKLVKKHDLKLLKEFRSGRSWTAIYQPKN